MTRAWTWSLNRGLVWARHPGASVPKRMTASWSGPTWGQPNTSLRRELPRPMAGSPRFVCFPPAASQQTHRRQIRCCQDIARQKTSLASATPNDTPAARRRCRPPACRRCIPMPDRGQQEPLRGLPPCVGRPLASTKKPLDRGSPIQVQVRLGWSRRSARRRHNIPVRRTWTRSERASPSGRRFLGGFLVRTAGCCSSLALPVYGCCVTAEAGVVAHLTGGGVTPQARDLGGPWNRLPARVVCSAAPAGRPARNARTSSRCSLARSAPRRPPCGSSRE